MPKVHLRQSLLNKRKQMGMHILSYYIVLRLWALVHRLKLSHLLVYYSIQGEVDLRCLYEACWKSHIKIYFPKITENRKMDFFCVTSLHDLNKHPDLHLFEPSGHEETLYSEQVHSKTGIVIPSLALDSHGNRLGFGRGFYDTYLSRYPQLVRIAPQFDHFILDKLPIDSWDQKISWIVTEKQTSLVLL